MEFEQKLNKVIFVYQVEKENSKKRWINYSLYNNQVCEEEEKTSNYWKQINILFKVNERKHEIKLRL